MATVRVKFELPDNSRDKVDSDQLARVLYGLYQTFDSDEPHDVERDLGSTRSLQYGVRPDQATIVSVEIQ